ncbi:MAG: hypothetical protein Q8L49_03795 [Burkholderiaceae bacterium]|nr:hypothetical protein [Burkholderiaceae bacterium]
MFGQSKPVVFERYGRRRSRWRLPRWLLLLLAGIATGAGGVVFLQQRYLPPRLSAEATRELRSAFEQADAERQRLKAQLGATSQQLDTALATQKRQDEELAAPRAAAQRLRDDMAALIATLPPDPRGGTVEVRAGRFAAQGGMLAYDVVLTRERDAAKPMAGVMQISVAGLSARGTEATAALKPVDLSIGSQALVRGRLPLPAGFKPRQASIQVFDRIGGKPLGMRVMLVK